MANRLTTNEACYDPFESPSLGDLFDIMTNKLNRPPSAPTNELKREISTSLAKARDVDTLKQRFTKKLDNLYEQWQSQKIIRARDKISFLVGVSNVLFSSLLLGFAPEYLHIWYTLQLFYFLTLRFYIYKKKLEHYFLADLCYFVNLLLFLFIWVDSGNEWLLIATYCLSYGSLSFAILAWRNSLVFHSLDKITSVFIHIFPELVLHSIIHLLPPDVAVKRFPAIGRIKSLSLGRAIWISSVAYFFWQISYYLLIQVRKREKIAAGHATSFTTLRKTYAKTWLGKIVLSFPEQIQPFLFMAIQYAYCVLTILPAPLWYSNGRLSAAFLTFIFLWSVWNGAGYYIDIFGRRFEKELIKLREEIHLSSASLSNSGKNEINLGNIPEKHEKLHAKEPNLGNGDKQEKLRIPK